MMFVVGYFVLGLLVVSPMAVASWSRVPAGLQGAVEFAGAVCLWPVCVVASMVESRKATPEPSAVPGNASKGDE